MNDTEDTYRMNPAPAYPEWHEDRVQDRVTAALNCIEGEVMIIRRRVADGTGAEHDTKILTDAIRRLTENLAVLTTLRGVLAWHGADEETVNHA